MPKPTLLQNIFNHPTQSYLGKHPSRHEYYHSVRNDMLRAAQSHPLLHDPLPLPSSTPPSVKPRFAPKNSDSDDNDEDTFFTPSASPRDSTVVDQSFSLNAQVMGAPHPTLPSTMDSSVDCGAKQHDIASVSDGPSDDSNCGNNDSGIVSHPEPQSGDDMRPVSPPESIRSASASSLVSLPETSELNSTSNVSEASCPTTMSVPSTSTRVTTPAASESEATGAGSRGSPTRSNSTRRKKAENRRSMTTYTDDDWAKDVRWLVSPTEANSNKRKSWHTVSKLSIAPTTSTTTTSVPKRRSARPRFDLDPTSMLPRVPLQLRAPHRRAASASTSNPHRVIGRRRMSAVWEEDEDNESASVNAPRRVHTDPAPLTSLARSRSLSSQQRLPSERARSPTSLLSGESGSIGSSAVSSACTSASLTVDVPNPLQATDGGTPSGFTSLVLPRAAYTPASNKRYSLLFGNSSHVDITRSGLAQTTMSTVSITKNAASSTVGHGFLRPRFLSLSSVSVLSPSAGAAKTRLPMTPSHLLSTLPRPLSFTSHTPPPSKVNSHQILVQVYAVALDGLDDRIVSEKVARKDCYGFVPGRSIVGRAIEVGFEVNNVSKSDWVIGLLDVRKCGALAEFVIVEKRRIARCPRPSPSLTLEQLALLPLCGVPAHRAVRTIGIDADTEQESFSGRALVLQGHDGTGALAVQALAYAGMHVTAHIPLHADTLRIRTASTSSAASSSEPSDEKGTSDFGVGFVENASTRDAEERVRKWGARGVRVGDAVDVLENCDAGSFEFVIDTVGGKRIWDACHRVLVGGGQFTTLVGDVSSSPALSPRSSSPSSSPSNSPFSFYHNSKNSRSHHDQTGGRAVPSINAHFRANLRSLRLAFKARKSVAYELVSPAADVDQSGEDMRDSLIEAVRRAAAGVFVPFVGSSAHDSDKDGTNSFSEQEKEGEMATDAGPVGTASKPERIVPFERAPELFGNGALSNGRTAVVRLID